MCKWMTFEDINEQAAVLGGYDQTYRQTGAGQYSGAFASGSYGDGVSLHIETANRSLLQEGSVPSSSLGIGFMPEPSGACTLNGINLGQHNLVLLPPKASFDARFSGSTSFMLISISLDTLSEYAEKALMPNRVWQTTAQGAANTLQSLKGWAKRSRASTQPLPSRDLIDDLIASLSWDSDLNAPLRLNACDQFKIYNRARDWIKSNLQHKISIAAMSRDIGACRRSIEYSVKSMTGESPQRYIRLMRLNEIRHALLHVGVEDGTITSLAYQWGISHLGRFSQEYAALFGELPSVTLSRRQLNLPN